MAGRLYYGPFSAALELGSAAVLPSDSASAANARRPTLLRWPVWAVWAPDCGACGRPSSPSAVSADTAHAEQVAPRFYHSLASPYTHQVDLADIEVWRRCLKSRAIHCASIPIWSSIFNRLRSVALRQFRSQGPFQMHAGVSDSAIPACIHLSHISPITDDTRPPSEPKPAHMKNHICKNKDVAQPKHV